MPIISRIGRRSIKVRLLIASIYILLIGGAITMVYPFLLMLSGTGRSSIDANDIELVPRFLYDNVMLYRKAIDGLYNEHITQARIIVGKNIRTFNEFPLPDKKQQVLVSDWEEFLKSQTIPHNNYLLGFQNVTMSRNSEPANYRAYKNKLYKEAGGDIQKLNAKYDTDFVEWGETKIKEKIYLERRIMPNNDSPFIDAWYQYKQQVPLDQKLFLTPTAFYRVNFLIPEYTNQIQEYNKQHDSKYKSYNDIILSQRAPKVGLDRKDWEKFVRSRLNLCWVKLDQSELQNYRNFLKVKYHGDIAKLNQSYKENYASFDVIPYPELKGAGAKLVDYGNFISGWHNPDTNQLYQAALDAIYIDGLEFKFRDYLKKKYGSIEKVNKILHSAFPDFDVIEPPQIEYQYQKIMENKDAYRWEFSTRNFKTVFSYIMLQGRGLYNTVIYCALAILCALTVNPIAAYALSRFGLPSTYKVLLFLMLTMAFPQMVTQIPNFLMMREIGILNTFWALILPSMASGYSIFLLKGFFDSLPKELYESAMLDGAGEFRMFFQFTMSLSKPILAVIALNAFTHAYSNFMMALLICQDPKMWTLMPWLYQLQMNSCQSVIYTSLIIASVPTFLIFMLCQNVIMRGIVVPVEK